MTLTSCC